MALGDRAYLVRGYFPNILEVDSPHEREVRAVIARILAARPGCFVDVGANLGQTLGGVLSIDPDREYLGFEPQLSACFFVERFLRDNGLERAQVLPLALSDANGVRKFWTVGEADVSASLIERSGQSVRSIVIPVRRGDEVLAELGIREIAAIKIDVEGAERDVVAGLSDTLARQRPPIVFEVLPNFEGKERRPLPDAVARRQSAAAEELATLLQRLGYRIYCIDPQGTEVPIDRFDLDNRQAFLGTNYVARAD